MSRSPHSASLPRSLALLRGVPKASSDDGANERGRNQMSYDPGAIMDTLRTNATGLVTLGASRSCCLMLGMNELNRTGVGAKCPWSSPNLTARPISPTRPSTHSLASRRWPWSLASQPGRAQLRESYSTPPSLPSSLPYANPKSEFAMNYGHFSRHK